MDWGFSGQPALKGRFIATPKALLIHQAEGSSLKILLTLLQHHERFSELYHFGAKAFLM